MREISSTTTLLVICLCLHANHGGAATVQRFDLGTISSVQLTFLLQMLGTLHKVTNVNSHIKGVQSPRRTEIKASLEKHKKSHVVDELPLRTGRNKQDRHARINIHYFPSFVNKNLKPNHFLKKPTLHHFSSGVASVPGERKLFSAPDDVYMHLSKKLTSGLIRHLLNDGEMFGVYSKRPSTSESRIPSLKKSVPESILHSELNHIFRGKPYTLPGGTGGKGSIGDFLTELHNYMAAKLLRQIDNRKDVIVPLAPPFFVGR